MLLYIYFPLPVGDLLKKSRPRSGEKPTHEYEYTYHLVCLINSYYSNAYTALCCIGVCCNNPLLGRKG